MTAEANQRPMRHARFRGAMRVVAAILFVGAGLNHFRSESFYVSIVPPGFPDPPLLVVISGVAEIAGGVGLLVPLLRRAAVIGLILLLLAVFPANVWMALHQKLFASMHLPGWAFWARLPLQFVLIAWVWSVR